MKALKTIGVFVAIGVVMVSAAWAYMAMTGTSLISSVDVVKSSVFPGTAFTVEQLLNDSVGADNWKIEIHNGDESIVRITIQTNKTQYGKPTEEKAYIAALFRVNGRESSLGEVYASTESNRKAWVCPAGMMFIDTLKNHTPLYDICKSQEDSQNEAVNLQLAQAGFNV